MCLLDAGDVWVCGVGDAWYVDLEGLGVRLDHVRNISMAKLDLHVLRAIRCTVQRLEKLLWPICIHMTSTSPPPRQPSPSSTKLVNTSRQSARIHLAFSLVGQPCVSPLSEKKTLVLPYLPRSLEMFGSTTPLGLGFISGPRRPVQRFADDPGTAMTVAARIDGVDFFGTRGACVFIAIASAGYLRCLRRECAVHALSYHER
jgi:hypothetical protein